MKKTVLSAILVSAACLSVMSGCGHTHSPAEAECGFAPVCAECGETIGAVKEHNWIDASCAAPMTCSDCGETQGEALPHQANEADCTTDAVCSLCSQVVEKATGHTPGEASYFAAARCTVCGEESGEALTPDFEKYGISADMEVGKTYTLNTMSGDGTTPITGEASISSYDIIDSNEQCQFREGYQWHIVHFTCRFSEQVARQLGASLDYTISNYYNITSFVDGADHSNSEFSLYTVEHNGEDAEIRLSQSGGFSGNSDGSFNCDLTFYIQMPVGYDGIVVGLNNSAIDARMNNYLHEVYEEADFLLFRLNG